MPLHPHRARPGALTRETAIVAALIVVVLVTGGLMIQAVVGGSGATTAQDSTGVPQVSPPILPAEDDESDAADGPDDTDASKDDKSEPESTADTTGSEVGAKAQRRVDAAVLERSEALGELAVLAEKRAQQKAKEQKAAERAAKKASSAPFSITVGSFNVLGSQHTAPGGSRRSFPPASTRSVGAVNRMFDHGVDIVGMQELQDDQLRAVQSRTGFAAYPGFQWGVAETDNSILYDSNRFEFVSGDRFIIPFMGRPRPQPILRLRERTTNREFYVVNTHPSAHDGKYLTERRQGQATLVSIVNNLKQSGLPVLVTGDMNDREIFYCNVVPQAGLTASNGGSYSAGCRPPPQPIAVDWVVGSGVAWSGYRRDTSPVTNKISDHFFISAVATFG